VRRSRPRQSCPRDDRHQLRDQGVSVDEGYVFDDGRTIHPAQSDGALGGPGGLLAVDRCDQRRANLGVGGAYRLGADAGDNAHIVRLEHRPSWR